MKIIVYTLVAVGLQVLTEQLEGIYIMYTLCKYTFFTNTTIPSTEPVIICMTLYTLVYWGNQSIVITRGDATMMFMTLYWVAMPIIDNYLLQYSRDMQK